MSWYYYYLIIFRRVSFCGILNKLFSCFQAPTWLRHELKNGIHNGENYVGEVDDGISSVDESAVAMSDQESDGDVFVRPKKDVATKKATRSQEKTYAKYRAKTKAVTETKIDEGVAMATATADGSPNSNYGSYESNTDTNVSFSSAHSD